MATKIDFERGMPILYFGGVAVVKHERNDLRQLADLDGKQIATPSVKSFGGYLMMAYEMLRADIPLPKPEKVLETGMPHDTSVAAVLNGTADAAFIRSGVIENMLKEGKLNAGQLRVINQQDFPMVPFATSTRLYPEWPVAAMPNVEIHQANEIAVALLSIPHRGALAKKIGFEGFNTPMDYRSVIDVLVALRQPPYDTPPAFTARDVLKKYSVQIVFFGILSALVFLLFVMLLRYNRRLGRLRQIAEEGDRRLRLFSEQLPGVLFQYRLRPDGSAHYLYVSDAVRRLYGVTPEAMQVDAKNLYSRVHPEDAEAYRARILQSAASMQEFRSEYRIVLDDGSVHWRLVIATPQHQDDGSILWHGYATDIDERKQEELRMTLLVAALEASANAIAITDTQGRIEWVNPAFCSLTGYSHEELIGQNPRVLKSGVHDEAFYKEMWDRLVSGQSWQGEIVNRKKDGTIGHEDMVITPVKNEKGVIHHFIAVKQDISGRKRMEEDLRKQATTDVLTGLPNRRYFFNLAEAELSRIKRGKAGAAAIIMLDLDHFKHVNDTYGHNIGDLVLSSLADKVSRTLRRSDFSGRYGGEEFVVLLPETSIEQALQFAERVRENLEGDRVMTDAGEIRYTASLGVAMMDERDNSVGAALDRADQALYRAKQNGRNRVETG